MKNTAILLFSILTNLCFSQVEVSESEILKLQPSQSIMNGEWTSGLENHRGSMGLNSYRSQSLDQQSLNRALYYAALIDYNSRDKRMLECVRAIPNDNRAHNKFFGNPTYFASPDSLVYQSSHLSFKESNYWLISSGEVMQEYVYLVKSKDKLTREALISKMIGYHQKNRGEDGFIKAYLKSESHRLTIEGNLNDTYGSSIVYIIHNWFCQEDKLWYQEVVVLNVTLFGRRAYDLKG
jgi:hypothetical protein